MPSKASKSTADVRKSKAIQRIEAYGISFSRAFPHWRYSPKDLGTNTLSTIEGVVKELQKRSLTVSAIEESLRKAAQVWEGRANRAANKPSAAQIGRLLEFLRTPSVVSDQDRPVLVPRKNVPRTTKKKKQKKRKRQSQSEGEEGGDQEDSNEGDSDEENSEEIEEEDSQGETDSEDEEDGEVDESQDEEDEERDESEDQGDLTQEDSEDEENRESSQDSGKDEREDRGNPDTTYHHSHPDQNDPFQLYNDDEDQPSLNHDEGESSLNHDEGESSLNHEEINEQRITRGHSRAKAVQRRQGRVSVVIPHLTRPLNEEDESTLSIERGRAAPLPLSHGLDFTSTDNSFLTFSQSAEPLSFALESSGRSSLPNLMARSRSITPSQGPKANGPAGNYASKRTKASRPSMTLNQLRSDQDAATQAVNLAEHAYIENEKRLQGILRSCTYEPPALDITCKEGTLPAPLQQQQHQQQHQQQQQTRKRKMLNREDDYEDDDDSDDGAIRALRLEQERQDEEWIASETRALNEFKHRRITSMTTAMGKRRTIMEKRAWAQRAVRVSQARIQLESKFETLRARYEGIEEDGHHPRDDDTHDYNPNGNRDARQGNGGGGGGGESTNGGPAANGNGNGNGNGSENTTG